MKKVGIVMGSDSDLPIVEKAINTLISKTGTGLDNDTDLNCFQVLHPEFQSIVPASIFLAAYEAWEKHHKIKKTAESKALCRLSYLV